jgi:uncharacterized repeat protein (TIGR01451 family)
MRRALLVCAAITFAIACTDNITEPVPDRPDVTPGATRANPTVAFATTTTEDGLSISTDKDDYQPGNTVYLTGYGWPANDVLHMVLTDDPLTHDPHEWWVNVGADGTFRDSTYVVDDGDVDVKFTLVATTTLATPARSLTVQFTDGITKVTGSPAGLTFSVQWAIHTNSTCTAAKSGGGNNSGTANVSPANPVANVGNAGGSEFQKLTADGSTSAGGTFKEWLKNDNTTTTANPACIPGVTGDGTPTYTAVYVDPVDLRMDKAHTDAFVHGSNGQFTLTARNDGGTATTGTVTVTDQIPTGLAYVSAAGTDWTCGTSGSPVTVTCTRTAAVAAGANAPVITLTVLVNAAAGAEITNTASVSGGGEPAAKNGNNSDSDKVLIDAPANAAPVATDDEATTTEDANVAIDVLANDTDDGGAASLVVVDLTQPAAGKGSVTLGADNRTVTYAPPAEFFGEATFTYKASDGAKQSAPATVKVTVNSVNDAPTFTKGADPTVLEDAGAQSVSGWATNISAGPANESSQTLTFTLTNDNNSLFTAQPSLTETGTLSYTPAPNAFGTANVTVKLRDNGGTANGGVDESTQIFQINVTGVNDVPSFAKGADQTVNEDAAAQSVPGWATSISAGPNEAGQVVDFIISNDKPELFLDGPAVAANGTLSYTPKADANGVATIGVKIHDDGGTANGGVNTSAEQTFTITITPVNDAPTFTAGTIPTVSESGTLQTVSGWLTSKSAGPPDESGQVLTFEITADASRFAAGGYPTLDIATGNLTYRAKSTPNTPIAVSVKLSDNGGTANGGVDNSTQQFQINVQNVAPSALSVTLPSGPVPITSAAQITVAFTDPGPEDVHTVTVNWGDATSPTVQTLTVGARTAQASHSYGQPGVYSVTVTVADGDNGSVSDTFEYIVIYDPQGGFVTGGGTINSPAGAYLTSPTTEGRANFGFVSKYVKNMSLPTGSTEFQFQAGDLNFKSTNYEWLVVSGTKGQYRGYGTINGGGNYRFVLTVDDGAPDKFRIRIWSSLSSEDGNGSLVYDNQLVDGADAYANAKTAIATGSIVVHAPNGKTAMK